MRRSIEPATDDARGTLLAPHATPSGAPAGGRTSIRSRRRMSGTLFILALIGIACEDSGSGTLATCDPVGSEPLAAEVAEPAVVPDHLLDPPAGRLAALGPFAFRDTISVLTLGLRADGATDN